MSEDKIHRKKIYSQMVIRKAFLQLLSEKSITKITVKDICTLADINRTTFYSNFLDIYDLKQQIDDELYNKISDTLKSTPLKTTKEHLVKLLNIVIENKDLCKTLFNNEDGNRLIYKIVYLSYKPQAEELFAASPNLKNREHFAYLFEFLASGGVGLIKKWINEDTKFSVSEIADMFVRFNIAANRLD